MNDLHITLMLFSAIPCILKFLVMDYKMEDWEYDTTTWFSMRGVVYDL